MLNEALLVAYQRQAQEQEKRATASLLDRLPVEVLREIAETGTVKLSFFCGPDGQQSWVEQFKGTPFFQQAIALEQEELQAEMARQQSSAVQRQKMDQEYAQMDQVRLKKKLLELQKARNEAQVLDGGGGPPAMSGSPDPMGTAPGAAAGPSAEVAQKTAARVPSKIPQIRQREEQLKNLARKVTRVHDVSVGAAGGAIAGSAATHHHHKNKEKKADAQTAHVEAADELARSMARSDAEKIAHANEVLIIGDAAGKMLAKNASGLAQAWKFVKKHPGVVGGAVGAAHGLLKRDGSITDALTEGAAGAAAGHAIGGIGSRMAKGKDLVDASKSYGKSTVKKVQKAVGYEAPKTPKTPKVPDLVVPKKPKKTPSAEV